MDEGGENTKSTQKMLLNLYIKQFSRIHFFAVELGKKHRKRFSEIKQKALNVIQILKEQSKEKNLQIYLM